MNKLMLVASATALALSLAGCNNTAKSADAAANTARETADSAGAMASNGIADVKQALSATPPAQEFANTAGRSDAFEIATSKLALKNGSSKQVKDFANEMITAHTESTTKIKAAAAKASPALTPDATLTDDQNSKLADLGKKTGADFDDAYIDGQVSAHQDTLALMRDYAEHGDNASLKTAATEIAPIVQKHLDHAKMLDNKQ